MRFYILACLLTIAAGRQIPIAPNVNAGPPSTETASGMQAPMVPDANAGPPSKETEPKNIFESIGKFFEKSAHEEKEHVTASERQAEIKENREDLAMGRLNVLKANLPLLREISAKLCSGASGAHLCEIRLKMFKSISDRIEQGDAKVIETLRKSAQLLGDFRHMTDNLRDAISSLTIYELKDRHPEGMQMIADINPMDGNIDRYEWSEYMKAIYLFTLSDDTARAIELKGKSLTKMKDFVSWDLRDDDSTSKKPV